MKKLNFIWLVIFPFLLLGCSKSTDAKNTTLKNDVAKEVSLQISAAASLKEALTDLQKEFQEKNPQIKISLDFDGSGAICNKVLAGAPIDGVVLASENDLVQLAEKNVVAKSSALLKNTLVLVTPKAENNTGGLTEILKKANKIAIGEASSVPAGKYAKETLTTLGLNEALQDKLVAASNVRQVLSYVEAGNADCGFVYATDALISDKVKVAAEVPAAYHAPIIYSYASLKGAKDVEAVTQFFDYLQSANGKKVFETYHFSMAE